MPRIREMISCELEGGKRCKFEYNIFNWWWFLCLHSKECIPSVFLGSFHMQSRKLATNRYIVYGLPCIEDHLWWSIWMFILCLKSSLNNWKHMEGVSVSSASYRTSGVERGSTSLITGCMRSYQYLAIIYHTWESWSCVRSSLAVWFSPSWSIWKIW